MIRLPIHRTRIGRDIVAEFAVPPTERLRKRGRVAIIAKGAPGMPGGSEFLSFLAKKGFYAILPRYRGTWESSGEFLRREPTEDIRDVLAATARPLVSFYEKTEYAFPQNAKVYIMAGSFGGPAALFLSADPRVQAVFAYAPVVDWRVRMPGEPLEEFIPMMKLVYGEGYRVRRDAWKKLKKGTFYNPATALKRVEGKKVFLFHTKDDPIISAESVRKFAANSESALYLYARGGHGGASSLSDPRVWSKIERILGRVEKR